MKRVKKSPTYYLLGKSAWQGDGWAILSISDHKTELEKIQESSDMKDGDYYLKIMSQTGCKREFGQSFEFMQDVYFES